jgi:hypothetical protein
MILLERNVFYDGVGGKKEEVIKIKGNGKHLGRYIEDAGYCRRRA